MTSNIDLYMEVIDDLFKEEKIDIKEIKYNIDQMKKEINLIKLIDQKQKYNRQLSIFNDKLLKAELLEDDHEIILLDIKPADNRSSDVLKTSYQQLIEIGELGIKTIEELLSKMNKWGREIKLGY